MYRFFDQVKEYVGNQEIPLPYSTVLEGVIECTESAIGFRLPQLLKDLYLGLGNGGFGPGLGIIGLKDGHTCVYGDIVNTFHQLKTDHNQLGRTWEDQLLPFCNWGCNTFSCVKCDDTAGIVTFEEGNMWPQDYSLEAFFQRWMNGIDILLSDPQVEIRVAEITNPFTGKTSVVRERLRKPHGDRRRG